MLKLHFFLFRLTTVLLLINTVINATPTVSINENVDFLCNGVLFPSSAITLAINACKTIQHNSRYPTLYVGTLNQSRLPMKLFPIMVDGHIYNDESDSEGDGYFVIFNQAYVPVDMIMRTSSKMEVKCSKSKSPSSLSPSDSSPSSNHNQLIRTRNIQNGYMCGEKFFSNLFISKVISHSLRKNEYHERLTMIVLNPTYSPHYQSLVWNIYDKSKLRISDVSGSLKQYMIISQDGVLVWKDPQTMKGPLIRCTQNFDARTGQPIPVNLDKSLEPGFQCGAHYFEQDYIKSQINKSRMISIHKLSPLFPRKHRVRYSRTDIYIWPAHPGRGDFSFNDVNRWYILLDPGYRVKCVATMEKNELHCCEKKKEFDPRPEELGHFLCHNTHIPNSQANIAKLEACDHWRFFGFDSLTKYDGPDFDVPGPYLIWALITHKNHLTTGDIFGIVMTYDCRLVGMLVKSIGSGPEKCRRYDDGSIPGVDPYEEVTDIRGNKRLKTN